MSDSTKQVPKTEAKKPVKRARSRNPLLTKVVIRHLPPTLTADQFKELISPISDHNYFYYVRGEPLLGAFSFSRAYINFINQDDILRFREKFDNFVFLDDKGNEYTAIVELALYQGAPKRRKKVDAKCKTIESDPDFLQFVANKENLNKPDVLPSVEECLEEIETKEKAAKHDSKITPLLEYINNAEHRRITEIKKKSTRDDNREKRRKEERLRKRKEKERDRKKPIGSKPTAKTGKELAEASANTVGHPVSQSAGQSVKSRDSKAEAREDGAAAKEPRKRERHRRRHDDKKIAKANDDKPSEKTVESKPGEKSRTERFERSGRPSNRGTAAKKEEPQTFTVRILKNESRAEPKSEGSTAKSKEIKTDAKSTERAEGGGRATEGRAEGSAKDRRAPDKARVKNKDRPSIPIYRPSPRSGPSKEQTKDPKETAKKPSQQSARGN